MVDKAVQDGLEDPNEILTILEAFVRYTALADGLTRWKLSDDAMDSNGLNRKTMGAIVSKFFI